MLGCLRRREGGEATAGRKSKKKSIRPAPQKPPLFWNAGWLLFVCGNAATFPDSIILLCFSHVAHPKMRPKIKIKEAKKRLNKERLKLKSYRSRLEKEALKPQHSKSALGLVYLFDILPPLTSKKYTILESWCVNQSSTPSHLTSEFSLRKGDSLLDLRQRLFLFGILKLLCFTKGR